MKIKNINILYNIDDTRWKFKKSEDIASINKLENHNKKHYKLENVKNNEQFVKDIEKLDKKELLHTKHNITNIYNETLKSFTNENVQIEFIEKLKKEYNITQKELKTLQKKWLNISKTDTWITHEKINDLNDFFSKLERKE